MGVTRLSQRVIARLTQAEACEPNLHYRDDLQIAKLTVLYASTGEAVRCTPDVLATYNVLGCHPDKVWSKIERQREALGDPEKVLGWKLPPKKPPQSAVGFSHVKLWCENTNAARELVAPRGANAAVLREPTISVPMAAPSIAALCPNPDDSPSGKKGEYFYDDAVSVIERSGAEESIRNLTLAAFAIRGHWPKKQGPVSPIIYVSVRSLVDKSGVYRSTVQRRIQRAMKGGFWRKTRDMNVWLECPKCGTPRESAQCPKCPHKGNGRNPKEFRATVTYAVDLQKFERTAPCRHVQQIRLKKAEVREMPAREVVEEQAPKPQEPIRRTAEHRNVGRPLTVKQRKELSDRIESYQQGRTAIRDVNGYIVRPLQPGSPEYIKPLPREAAILAACQSMARGDPDRGFEGEGVALQRAREAAMEMEESS